MSSTNIISSTLPDYSSATNHETWSSARHYMESRLQSEPSAATTKFEIPVIDLTKSYSSLAADRQLIAKQIHSACTTSGFFYITNHGIPLSCCSSVLKQAERLLKGLPKEKKEKLHVRHSPYYHGWEPSESTSINGDAESKECYNWGYEESLDETGGDGQYVHIDGSKGQGNLWPGEDDLPGFYAAIKQYYGQVLGLARHMSRLFALALGLPETYFDPMTTHPGGVARLIYYPPGKESVSLDADAAGQEIGLGAHSDYQCFTLLLSSSTPGLEILSPDGRWIRAPAVENGLVVNVGDFLMRLTNDLYKSTIHRVVNRTGSERYSVPFFFSINHDLVVETLPSCVDAEHPSKYPPINAGDYIMQRLAMTKKDGTGLY